MVRLAWAGLALLQLGAVAAAAQVYVPPSPNRTGPTDSTLYVTATDGQQNVQDVWDETGATLPLNRFDYPRDSIRGLAAEQARQWLIRLERKGMAKGTKGIETEPYFKLMTAAHEDSLAERAIAARLATPGLSTVDRSFTYLAAVEAFADPSTPALMAESEKYLTKLKAMGPMMASRQLEAELALVRAYDELGRSVDVSRHGIAAMHLLPLITLKDATGAQIYNPLASPYPTIVRAVAVQPNGKQEIAEMNQILASRLTVSPDSVAMDSMFYYFGLRFNQSGWKAMSSTLARIGEIGGDIPSNRWLNMPDTGNYTMKTNDGKVHVVLVMTYQCPGCVIAVMHLQQIADADPKMQAVLVTFTADENYGNRVVTPEENEVWQEGFWKEKKIRFPIALWVARMTDTLKDGSIEESLRDDSAFAHYPEIGKPVFYIVDGHGRIRAYFNTSNRVIEHQVAAIVRRLELEEANQQTSSTAGQ